MNKITIVTLYQEENLNSDDAKQDINDAENIIMSIERYLIKEGFLKDTLS